MDLGQKRTNSTFTLNSEKFNEFFNGTVDENSNRNGDGFIKWTKKNVKQKYIGHFVHNNLHGEGVYSHYKLGGSYLYNGLFYANHFEGFSTVLAANCTLFEGLFRNDKRFGPGVVTYLLDGCRQDVGWWNGLQLIRLCQPVLPQWIPKLQMAEPMMPKKPKKTAQDVANKQKRKSSQQPLKSKVLSTVRVTTAQSEETSDNASDEKQSTVSSFGAYGCNKPIEVLRNLGAPDEVVDEYFKMYNNNIRDKRSIFFNRPLFNAEYYKTSFPSTFSLVLYKHDYGSDNRDGVSEESSSTQFSSEAELSQDEVRELICRLLEVGADSEDDFRKLLMYVNNRLPQIEGGMCAGVYNYEDYKGLANTSVMDEITEFTYSNRNLYSNISYNLPHLIRNLRERFGQQGKHESACVAFLAACSEGKELEMYKIQREFDINPDVCDGHGNNGVMYAAARDRVKIIWSLTNLGACLDMRNDDGLAPLVLVLLRHIAVLNDIIDWEAAFLNKRQRYSDVVQDVGYQSLLDVINYWDATFFKSGLSFKLHDSTNSILLQPPKLLYEIYEHYNLLMPTASWQHFQSDYLVKEYKRSRYMFNMGSTMAARRSKGGMSKVMRAGAKTQKKKQQTMKPTVSKQMKTQSRGKPGGKPMVFNQTRTIPRSCFNKLVVVFNTLVILLHCGADPNEHTLPLPPIILAIFTESVDIMEVLLKFKANPNTTCTKDELNPLHVLASIRPSENSVHMAALLIKYNIDMDARTQPDIEGHSLGSVKSMALDGKTALHIICLRTDFEYDPGGYMKMLAKIMVYNGASMSAQYCGFNALTLTMLRANVGLFKVLLECGADPNEPLGEDYGTPLTFFTVERLRQHFESELCIEMFNDLISYGGNPLKQINGKNTNDFLHEQTQIANEILKQQQAQKSSPPKSKQSNIKAHDQPSVIIKKHITRASIQFLLEHYRSKAFLALMIDAIHHDLETEANRNLARFITSREALTIVQQYADHFFFNLDDDFDYDMVMMVLDFIRAAEGPGKRRKKPESLMILLEAMKFQSSSNTEITHRVNNYMNTDFNMYKVCLNCLLQHGKFLLPCGYCGLVYFCSQSCNVRAKKMRRFHTCEPSYKDEYKNYKTFANMGMEYQCSSAMKFTVTEFIITEISHQTFKLSNLLIE